MDRRAAKELAHIQVWLKRVQEVTRRGKDAYLSDDLLQEAGDSLVMKLGEAANRLSRLGLLPPEGVECALAVANRNFIIHQYDQIDRDLTWLTLSRDLVVLADVAGTALLAGHRDDQRSNGPTTEPPRHGTASDALAAPCHQATGTRS